MFYKKKLHIKGQESEWLKSFNSNTVKKTWSNTFKIINKNYFQLRILYVSKLSILSEARIQGIQGLKKIYLPYAFLEKLLEKVVLYKKTKLRKRKSTRYRKQKDSTWKKRTKKKSPG